LSLDHDFLIVSILDGATVTHATDGQEMHSIRRFSFEFLPKLADMIVHGVSRRLTVKAQRMERGYATQNLRNNLEESVLTQARDDGIIDFEQRAGC
jgi:hypothetical protein